MATASMKLDSRAALGATLRKVRMEQGWSQYELADAAKVDRSYLNRLEQGKHSPTFDLILRLCRLLQTPVEEFSRRVLEKR